MRCLNKVMIQIETIRIPAVALTSATNLRVKREAEKAAALPEEVPA
jgi:hypothetical protein